MGSSYADKVAAGLLTESTKGLRPLHANDCAERYQGIELGRHCRPRDSERLEIGSKQESAAEAKQTGGEDHRIELIVHPIRQQQLEGDHGAQCAQRDPQ